MTRAKNGSVNKKRHKKVLKLAKGYRGRAKSCFRVAVERVEKGMQYAYRDRKNRKRDFRALWIQRINAGAREHGLKYSQLINGLNLAGIELDRKILSEMAINDKAAFKSVVEQAAAALEKNTTAKAA